MEQISDDRTTETDVNARAMGKSRGRWRWVNRTTEWVGLCDIIVIASPVEVKRVWTEVLLIRMSSAKARPIPKALFTGGVRPCCHRGDDGRAILR